MAARRGKCIQFGGCSKADNREIVEVQAGEEFVCTECGKPLEEIQEGGGPSSRKKLLVLLAAMVAVIGVGVWALWPGRQGPETPKTAEKPKESFVEAYPCGLKPASEPDGFLASVFGAGAAGMVDVFVSRSLLNSAVESCPVSGGSVANNQGTGGTEIFPSIDSSKPLGVDHFVHGGPVHKGLEPTGVAAMTFRPRLAAYRDEALLAIDGKGSTPARVPLRLVVPPRAVASPGFAGDTTACVNKTRRTQSVRAILRFLFAYMASPRLASRFALATPLPAGV